MTEPNAYQWILDMIAPEPVERRCVLWWEGERYGRHFPGRNADGTAVVPHNVCNRAFLSRYPATVCDTCAENVAAFEHKAELDAQAAANAAASSRAQAYGKGGQPSKRGAW